MAEQLALFEVPRPPVSEYRRRTGHIAPPPCTCGPCRERELAKYEEPSDARP